MPIRVTGAYCERPGCRWTRYHAGLCVRCFRLARMLSIEPVVLVQRPRLDADPAALAADMTARDRQVIDLLDDQGS